MDLWRRRDLDLFRAKLISLSNQLAAEQDGFKSHPIFKSQVLPMKFAKNNIQAGICVFVLENGSYLKMHIIQCAKNQFFPKT